MEEAKSTEFKSRDVSFHLFIAVVSIGISLYGALMLAPKLIGFVLCAVAGGMNLGVVIESRRWKSKFGWVK